MENSFQWVNNPTPLSQVPSDFTLPEEMRLQLSTISTLTTIPVIDLKTGGDGEEFPPELLDQISRACEKYGFFQVINHGIPEDVCDEMLEAVKELMESPAEVKSDLYSEDVKKDGRILRRHLKTNEEVNGGKIMMWSELFFHSWHPKNDFSSVLPRSPLRYRKVMPNYAKEVNSLFTRLLNLISVSLGLNKNCIVSKNGENPSRQAQANYYPPCPDPDLTIGLGAHTDMSTLTILRQSSNVCGLQVLVNEKWVSVEPIPNSFVVNIGDQLQVLSNNRYKSVHHRVAANKDKLRVSMAMFYGPSHDTMISPVEQLVDEEHPAVYRSYRFKEFIEEFHRQDGTRRRVKEAFEA